jgi:hypothetical protein
MARTIIHGLEVIHQRQDILVAHRHLLQHGDLIPNLFSSVQATVSNTRGITKAEAVRPTMCSRPAIRRLLITLAA